MSLSTIRLTRLSWLTVGKVGGLFQGLAIGLLIVGVLVGGLAFISIFADAALSR